MQTISKKRPRTYRIVGPQRQIDERDTPHHRADRGELGEHLLLWRKTRWDTDKIRRLFNSFRQMMRKVPDSAVNPDRISVTDPAVMSSKIKEIAHFFGADVVGISHLDQAYVYSHRARSYPAEGAKPGDPIHITHQYAICLGFADNYDRYMTSNSQISGTEYSLGNNSTILPTFLLAGYIRDLGYPARAHNISRYELNPIPLAINAGLGELGRHGMLIHEEYGSRIHLAVVTTDLPLIVDNPVDIGVEDFCKLCMKCARNCPSYSISFGDKVVINGVEKWAINVDTCYKHRLAGRSRWAICTICVSSCPYNKPSAWWHTLAVSILEKTPIPLRPLYIRPLIWIDDLLWGKKPWRHMEWLEYDNTPVPVTCDIPGCVANHTSLHLKRLHRPKPNLQSNRQIDS